MTMTKTEFVERLKLVAEMQAEKKRQQQEAAKTLMAKFRAMAAAAAEAKAQSEQSEQSATE